MLRAIIVATTLFASPAFAQQSAIPRTPDGHPDFTGTWRSAFLNEFIERGPGVTTFEVDDAVAEKIITASRDRMAAALAAGAVGQSGDEIAGGDNLPTVGGKWRTSVIVDPPDGKLPSTAMNRRLRNQTIGAFLGFTSDYERRGLLERCIQGLSSAPFGIVPVQIFRQLVQTPDHLVIVTESDMTEARLVGIGAAPRPAGLTSVMGDSTARWEGDVLVVETRNVRTPQLFALTGFNVRPESLVTERFQLIDANEILYQFTIEDADLYERPWRGEYGLQRSAHPMYEAACHEGNRSLGGILHAGRLQEERRAAAQPTP